MLPEPSPTGGAQRAWERALALGIALVIVLVWTRNLTTSLWLDETCTYWVIRDGWSDLLARAVGSQQSLGYHLFLRSLTPWIGTSEIALRLPSLLAMALAAVLLMRIGASLFDRELGLMAALIFATEWTIAREAGNARPYALSLLLVVAAAWCLLRWRATDRSAFAWLCALLLAALVNVHILFSLALPAFALYALATRSGRARCARLHALGACGVVVLGLLLCVPVLRTLLAHRSLYGWATSPGAGDLVLALVWPPVGAGLLAGLAAAWLLGRNALVSSAVSREAGAFVIAWGVAPPLILFGVSLFGIQVFDGRYYAVAEPALCLLYAFVLRALPALLPRLIAASTTALLAVASLQLPVDDFRGAAQSVREFATGADIPVLIASGLIEGEREEWVRDPALREYMAAPIVYYPTGGTAIPIPRRVTGQPFVRELLETQLARRERFAVIEGTRYGARALSWFAGAARGQGYRFERRFHEGVLVGLFTRERGAAPGSPGRAPGGRSE